MNRNFLRLVVQLEDTPGNRVTFDLIKSAVLAMDISAEGLAVLKCDQGITTTLMSNRVPKEQERKTKGTK